MSRPSRRSNGKHFVRKAVPAALRPFLGGRWELREDIPETDPEAVKRLTVDALARMNATLASARAEAEGRPCTLTMREIDAVVGAAYVAEAARYADDPGTFEDWNARGGYFVDFWEPEDGEAPNGPRVFKADPDMLASTEAMLIAQGVTVGRATLRIVAERWAAAQIRLAHVMERRCQGDWTADENLARFPNRTAAAAEAPEETAVPIADLVAGWAAENGRTGKALYDRERTAAAFATFLGHTDASKVTADDVVRWKENRLAAGRSTKTVANDLNELSPVWRWAKVNRKLDFAANPFAGLAPRQRRTSKRPRVPFTSEEAARILTAARKEAGFLRWLPWVLCYTAARLGEACQAAKEDVKQTTGTGPWCLSIHEENEGATLKTPQSERLVPLHPALIAEGFLDYVAGLPAGSPLFPDLARDRFGARKGTATKVHGRWVRKTVGITDRRKDPAHAWRHTFEDRAREAGVPQAATDAMMGHLNATNESEGYGRGYRFMPDTTAPHVARMSQPLPNATPNQ